MPGDGSNPKRVLIVDDEALVFRALARALRPEYVATTLSCPEDALRLLAAGDSWDAVLSDVMMPAMDGFEFTKRGVLVRPERSTCYAH